jgi:hypothetical protein
MTDAVQGPFMQELRRVTHKGGVPSTSTAAQQVCPSCMHMSFLSLCDCMVIMCEHHRSSRKQTWAVSIIAVVYICMYVLELESLDAHAEAQKRTCHIVCLLVLT